MVPVLLVTALPMKFTGTWMSWPPASCIAMVRVSPPLACLAWMRGRSDCGSAREIFTGWISLMVTSELAVVLAVAAAIILPGWIRMGPVLPLMGDFMVVYSRFRRAAFDVALACR